MFEGRRKKDDVDASAHRGATRKAGCGFLGRLFLQWGAESLTRGANICKYYSSDMRILKSTIVEIRRHNF
jgi:hypothetical protein